MGDLCKRWTEQFSQLKSLRATMPMILATSRLLSSPRFCRHSTLKTIQKIAPGQEGLDVPGFNKWVTMVFGKASDEDFESGMRMLLSTAEATSPRKKRAAAGSAVDEEWEVICCRSSGGSGTPLVDSTWAKLLSATNTGSVL